jgi:hypothetical protein
MRERRKMNPKVWRSRRFMDTDSHANAIHLGYSVYTLTMLPMHTPLHPGLSALARGLAIRMFGA